MTGTASARGQTVGWTDPPPPPVGLDQLGLRESSEGQYTKLLDFTTSVTWHPRYYSFLCWSLREAFARTSEGFGNTRRVDVRAQDREMRRCDYAMAAATLAGDPMLLRVIGVDKIGPALRDLDDAGSLEIRDDHVGGGAGAGSYDVYAGPMSNLGLLREFEPSERGERLADAFAATLRAANAEALFTGSVTKKALTGYGEVLGLGRLTQAATTVPAVAAERAAIREAIVDWSGAARGGNARRRLLTIGVILALHELAGSEPVDLRRFREAILLGGLRLAGGKPLELPPAYSGVLRAWRLYQAHANVVFALEAFLSLALEALVYDGRALVPRADALDRLGGWAGKGWADPGFPKVFSFDPDEPLAAAVARLEPVLGQRWQAWEAEPELADLLDAQWSSGSASVRNAARATAAAASLLIWSQARLSAAQKTFAEAWLDKDVDTWRLPPWALVADLRASENAGHTVGRHVRRVIDELTISQHARNVRRKLVFEPGKFTARLIENGGRLEHVSGHHPGTSSPRFENAVWYLEALGYLEPAGAAGARVVTADGKALSREINRRAGDWS